MAIEEDPPPTGAPEWFVSFGDMMSLLLTFFILLVSMSEMKKDDKFHAIVDSLREQFGVSLSAVMIRPGELRPPSGPVLKLTKAVKNQRDQLLHGSNVSGPRGDFDRLEVIRAGKHSGASTVVYFDDFNADLTEEAKEQLWRLNEEIAGKPQKIEIRGHTSLRTLSQGGKDADHWNVAYRRALTTMEFMVKELELDSRRIRVTSAGANEPVASAAEANETPHNARVEVIVLDEVISDFRIEDKTATVPASDEPGGASKPEPPKPSAPAAEKTTP